MRRLVSKAAALVRDRLVHPLLPRPIVARLNRNDRVGALQRAWGYVYSNQLKGAYYEFGVYRGASFRESWKALGEFTRWQKEQLTAEEPWRREVAAAYAKHTHHFYAFDTFSGIPDNPEGHPIFKKGTFAGSLEAFREGNELVGLRESPSVRYFQGTFAEVSAAQGPALKELDLAAVVNVDCDLYESSRDALALIAPKLQQGTVLMMDDWNQFLASDAAGSRRALREFKQANPVWRFEPWFAYEFAGQAFFVHRDRPLP